MENPIYGGDWIDDFIQDNYSLFQELGAGESVGSTLLANNITRTKKAIFFK